MQQRSETVHFLFQTGPEFSTRLPPGAKQHQMNARKTKMDVWGRGAKVRDECGVWIMTGAKLSLLQNH
jgi:hypothetical protein